MGKPRPAEWPADLPPASSAEFDSRVVGWLLDRSPGVVRGSELRRQPLALGVVARHLVMGEIEGLRRAYSTARTELGGSSADLATTLPALETVAADLLRTQREIEAVIQALRDREGA